ncbi:MAG TPA: ATP-binding protein [Acidimicrobiia bacterium]|nr:ATP-binding protein [Acidimicrobiia bacterium]
MTERDWRVFPDENPNLVIEIDAKGNVRYANPEARTRFPDIDAIGWRHPLLSGIHSIIGGFATGRDEYVSREVRLGDSVFEQKVCFSVEDGETLIRVYAHDVTALARAESRAHELAQRVVYAQEEERHRVSRELHDEAGQALAALKISLQLMRDDAVASHAELVPGLDDAVSLVESTRHQIRLIARDLRPPSLDGLGLEMALGGFCNDFAKRTNLAIRYSSTGEVAAPDAVEVCLYRLLQEGLSNVAVHAAAAGVEVALDRDGDVIRLSIADDGVGFDPAEVAERTTETGLGLAGMRERIELLDGVLSIEAAVGKGTSITAELPVQ